MSSRQFTCVLGEESQAYIKSIATPNSIYTEAYWEAFETLADLVHRNQEVSQAVRNQYSPHYDISNANKLKASLQSKSIYNVPSNIITFSADRGCGKTSTMLTFAEALSEFSSGIAPDSWIRFCRQLQQEGITSTDRIEYVKNKLENARFVTLPTIDPSLNNSQGNILSLVLSHLYHHAEKNYENSIYAPTHPSQLSARNILIDLFQKCAKSISILDKSYTPHENGSLLDLVEQSKTSELRDNLHFLVQHILDASIVSNQQYNRFLVIPIDDADLDFSQMNTTLELIRGYLMIPNVIILLAADTKLISTIITDQFRNKLSPQTKQRVDESTLISLVEQYMLKLFPPKQVIRLPNMMERLQLNRESIELYVLDRTEDSNETITLKKDIFYKQEKEQLPELDFAKQAIALEERLLRLIFKRTGLYFPLHHDYQYILPETQRGIVHLVALLSQMTPVTYLLKRDPLNDYQRSTGSVSPQVPSELNRKASEFYFPSDSKDIVSYLSDLGIWKHNIQLYHDYFMNEWVLANLNEQDNRFMHQLNMLSLGRKNNYVLDYLQSLEGRIYSRPDAKRLYAFMSSELKKYAQQHPNSRLEFAIQTLYSIIAQKLILDILYSHYSRNTTTSRDFPAFLPLMELFGTILIDDSTVPIDTHSQLDWFWTCDSSNEQLMLYLKMIHVNTNTIRIEDALHTYFYQLWNTDFNEENYSKRFVTDSVPSEPATISANLSTPLLNCLYISDLFDINSIDGNNRDWIHIFVTAHTTLRNLSLRILVNWDCRKRFVEHLIRHCSKTSERTIEQLFKAYNQIDKCLGITTGLAYQKSKQIKSNVYEAIWNERLSGYQRESEQLNALLAELENQHNELNKQYSAEASHDMRDKIAEEFDTMYQRIDSYKESLDRATSVLNYMIPKPTVRSSFDSFLSVGTSRGNNRLLKESLVEQTLHYLLIRVTDPHTDEQERKKILQYVIDNERHLEKCKKLEAVYQLLSEVRGYAILQLISMPYAQKTFWEQVESVTQRLLSVAGRSVTILDKSTASMAKMAITEHYDMNRNDTEEKHGNTDSNTPSEAQSETLVSMRKADAEVSKVVVNHEVADSEGVTAVVEG